MGDEVFVVAVLVALAALIGLPQSVTDWTRWHVWRAGIGIAAGVVMLLGVVWSALGMVWSR
jgi:succinate dehydrogenase hydrophobic anchor subunit